jgi:hypothetical protein
VEGRTCSAVLPSASVMSISAPKSINVFRTQLAPSPPSPRVHDKTHIDNLVPPFLCRMHHRRQPRLVPPVNTALKGARQEHNNLLMAAASRQHQRRVAGRIL